MKNCPNSYWNTEKLVCEEWRLQTKVNQLAKKTWLITKAIHGLENHIWLYIAWNNKYKIK